MDNVVNEQPLPTTTASAALGSPDGEVVKHESVKRKKSEVPAHWCDGYCCSCCIHLCDWICLSFSYCDRKFHSVFTIVKY